MKVTRMIIIPFCVLGLSACSAVSERGFFKDESQTYRKVKELDGPVAIPQNMSANGVQNYYEVPAGSEAMQSAGQPPLTPPGSNFQDNKTISQQDKIRNAENAKIQGHTSFAQSSGPVNANMGFSQAWNKVGGILQSANYKIVEKDSALGTYYVIDTRAGKVKKDAPIYQVHVKSAGNSARISVTPANPGLQNLLNRNLGR